jgi:hypothetical protein
MEIVKQTLDKMIAAAESVDHWLHDKLDKLRELRLKLDTFAAADGSDADEALVGALREVGNAAE